MVSLAAFCDPRVGSKFNWVKISVKELIQNMGFIAKDPLGLDSDRWIPLRGGATPRHLECGIHRSESSPIGVFRINPAPGG